MFRANAQSLMEFGVRWNSVLLVNDIIPLARIAGLLLPATQIHFLAFHDATRELTKPYENRCEIDFLQCLGKHFAEFDELLWKPRSDRCSLRCATHDSASPEINDLQIYLGRYQFSGIAWRNMFCYNLHCSSWITDMSAMSQLMFRGNAQSLMKFGVRWISVLLLKYIILKLI